MTCPQPDDIPKALAAYYSGDWQDGGEWLGHGVIGRRRKRQNFRSLKNARRFARSLKLASATARRDYLNGEYPRLPPCPVDIPRLPERVYKESGWHGFADFL